MVVVRAATRLAEEVARYANDRRWQRSQPPPKPVMAFTSEISITMRERSNIGKVREYVGVANRLRTSERYLADTLLLVDESEEYLR